MPARMSGDLGIIGSRPIASYTRALGSFSRLWPRLLTRLSFYSESNLLLGFLNVSCLRRCRIEKMRRRKRVPPVRNHMRAARANMMSALHHFNRKLRHEKMRTRCATCLLRSAGARLAALGKSRVVTCRCIRSSELCLQCLGLPLRPECGAASACRSFPRSFCGMEVQGCDSWVFTLFL